MNEHENTADPKILGVSSPSHDVESRRQRTANGDQEESYVIECVRSYDPLYLECVRTRLERPDGGEALTQIKVPMSLRLRVAFMSNRASHHLDEPLLYEEACY